MNPETTTILVLRMMRTPGVGAARISKVLGWLRHSGMTAEEFLSKPQPIRGTLNEEQAAFLAKENPEVDDLLSRTSAMGVRYLFLGDPLYPRRLATMLGDKAPPMITYLGNPVLMDAPAVSFCGSRKASEKGLSVAADCASQLGVNGIDVVSGYAAGVDMKVHTAALESGGTTAVVLAEGVLHFRLKKDILSLWDWNRAVVLSEFNPGAMWSVSNAMQRNKTIIGLSDAMILIEAGATGGSIEAGKACLEMGHPLFAPVYEGMPESAIGNRQLLAAGAHPLLRSRATGRANITQVIALAKQPTPAAKAS